MATFAPIRAFSSLMKIIRDPDDLPEVFVLIEALSWRGPDRLMKRFAATAVGARLLEERPEIVPLLSNRDWLRTLPDGSLGRAYLDFVESEGISAAGLIAAAETVDGDVLDEKAAWLKNRLRDTHDLWHAVLGYRGDVLGEVAQLAFIFAQTGNPAIGVMAAAAWLKTVHDTDSRRLIAAGYRRGRRAGWLPAVAWEEWLERPVAALRAELAVGDLPKYVDMRSADLKARAA